jgi:hypothetical protein
MWALPSANPAVEITVATRGMSKGLAQTDEPQLLAKAYDQLGQMQVGAQWKNVSSNSADGEASLFVSFARTFGKVQLAAGAAYKVLTGAPRGVDRDSIELNAAVSRKVGRVAVRVNTIFSPDDIGSAKRSLYLEGGPSFDVSKSVRLSANLGHRWRQDGAEYTSVNAGAAYTLFKGFAADLRYYRTNRAELGDAYGQRLVLSGKVTF